MQSQFKNKIEEIKANYDIEKTENKDYNIFRILKITKYEVSTHSRFIKDLIDPKSNYHSNGTLFLKLFLQNLNLEDFFPSIETCNVKVEYPLNKKDLEQNTHYDKNKDYGRIDILIENSEKTKAIIIENKIFARDQFKQLERYYNYAELKYGDEENFEIFYMNLLGEESLNINACLKRKVKTISYKEHVVNWLEKCIPQCENEMQSVIISHYINTIKFLTAESLTYIRNREIQFQILKNYNDAKNEKEYLNKISEKKKLYDSAIEDIRVEIRKKILLKLKGKYPKVHDKKVDNKLFQFGQLNISSEENRFPCFVLENLVTKKYANIFFAIRKESKSNFVQKVIIDVNLFQHTFYQKFESIEEIVNQIFQNFVKYTDENKSHLTLSE